MRSRTLLLIARHSIARVDVRIKAETTIDAIAYAARPANASLATLAQNALGLISKRPSSVLLFSSDFWTGRISIPSDLHALANDEELRQAAFLESEMQSGISPFHSQVALHRLENDPQGDTQYWVTQILDSDLECIDRVFQSANVRWIGAAHPNGLDDGSDSESSALQTTLDIQEWARKLGPELKAKVFQRPIFVPPTKTMSPKQQNIWASITGSFALSLCAGVYWHDRIASLELEQQSQSLAKRIEETESLQRNLIKAEANLDLKRKKLRDDQVRFDVAKNELERVLSIHELVSDHCSSLIDAIAGSADMDSWLRRIESQERRTLLKGIALNEASAHRFASALEQHPKLTNHLVSPAQTHALENELIEFSIAIDLVVSPLGTAQSKGETP